MRVGRWPAGEGEMAGLIRTHDWAKTPLGPIDVWPQSLRTSVDLMLSSEATMSLVWGGRAIHLYNDAYARLIGPRHPGALGRSPFETFPEVRPLFEPYLAEAMAGRTVQLKDQPNPFVRNHVVEDAWFDISYNPVQGEGDEILGVLSIMTETTERVLAERRELAEAELRESEERQAFLLKLSDALRPLADPIAVQETASRLLGEYLGVDRASYGELKPDNETMVVARDWTSPGMLSVAGEYRIDEFGKFFTGPLREGRPSAIEDALTDPRVSRATYESTWKIIGVRAGLACPLVKQGRFVAAIFVHQSGPRAWSEGDVSLVAEVGERTWEAVERAWTEEALRTNEKRMRGQKEAFQAAIDGASLEDSLGILARIVAEETTGEARTAFYIADPDVTCLNPIRGAGDMPESYTKQVEGFAIGKDSLACGLATATGRPVLTRDVFEEPLWNPWVHLAKEYDFRGCWSFPIETRDGKPIGTFAQYFTTAREAGPHDLALADVVTQAAAIIVSRHTEAQERTRAEEALRRSEEQLQLALDASAMGTFTWYPEEDRGEPDARMLELFGLPEDGVLNLAAALASMIHPDDRERYAKAVARSTDPADSSELREDIRVIHPDGTEHWVDVTARAFFEGERPKRMVGSAIDITERKRAEEALRASEERYRTLVENVADHAIFMLDTEGIITEWTEGARRVKGYTAEEVVGRHFSMFYTPGEVASGEPERLLEQAAREGRADREAWRVHKDGGRIWANEVATAVRNAEGRLMGFTKISRDLTERRALEQERERLRTIELTALAEGAERERISRELHDRVAHHMGVAHQSLELFAALREGAPERAAERLDLARETTRVALDHTRALSAELKRLQEEELAEGLEAAFSALAVSYVPDGIAMGVSFSGEESAIPKPVGTHVYLAMREAIRNAVRHSGCSRIGVTLEARDGELYGEVEDDGEGFDTESQEEATPSWGVGLRSMRERAEMLGGSLRVDSEPGEGTRVDLRVPLDGWRP